MAGERWQEEVAMKFKQPTGFMPGIYFNMPEEQYHADKALSHSGITDILVSLMDYWINSPLNPDREFKESDAMKFGKRCHMMLLEEKKFLETHNVAGGGWKKDKITITSTEFQLIKESTRIIRSDPKTSAFFQHGFPEVSIIVKDPVTGIVLRIRVDWLRTFGCVDLKRLRSIQKKKLGYDIQQYGYDIQDYLYRYVVSLAKQQLRTGKIKAWDATKPDALVPWVEDLAWLKAFAEDERSMFVFFVQRSTRPFIYRVFNFGHYLREEARTLTERGILKYKDAIEKYGESNWPYGSAEPEEFDVDDMPRRSLTD